MKAAYEQKYINVRNALVENKLIEKSGGSSIDKMNPIKTVKDKLLQVVESCDRQAYTDQLNLNDPKSAYFNILLGIYDLLNQRDLTENRDIPIYLDIDKNQIHAELKRFYDCLDNIYTAHADNKIFFHFLVKRSITYQKRMSI